MKKQKMPETQEVKKKTKLEYFMEWLVFFAFCFALIGGFMMLMYSTWRFEFIDGTSMQPTINEKFQYTEADHGSHYSEDGILLRVTKDVHVGDILTLRLPGEETDYIKRVLAEEGDMITFIRSHEDRYFYCYVIKYGTYNKMLSKDADGNLYIEDGSAIVQELYEPYLNEENRRLWTENKSIGFSKSDLTGDVEYEGDFYSTYFDKRFLLNPKYAIDRTERCYNKDNIVIVKNAVEGQDVLFWKIADTDIFFAGDHRLNSKDGRFLGTLNRKNVIGKVKYIIDDAQQKRKENRLWMEQISLFFVNLWEEMKEFFAWG